VFEDATLESLVVREVSERSDWDAFEHSHDISQGTPIGLSL